MEFDKLAVSTPPKVLFLGKRYYTNRDALEEKYGRIYQLPYHWSALGIETRLLLIDYHGREFVARRDENLAISSVPIRSLQSLQLLRELVLGNGYTHIIATGDCYIGLLGLAISKRNKADFIFDVYDKYDDFPGYRRLLGFSPFPYLLNTAKTRLFASRKLLEDYGHQDHGDFTVANGIDLSRFRPVEMSVCRDALKLPRDRSFVGYFGSMEPDRGINDLARAIQKLRAEGQKIELLIGGRSDSTIDLDTPGIRYVGNVPFDEMPVMLGACDLLAVPYRRSSFMDAGASNKIAEALAVNRPIVATRTPNLLANFPEAARLLDDRLAEPGSAESIACAIRRQLDDPVTAPLPEEMDWVSIASVTASRLGLSPHLADIEE